MELLENIFAKLKLSQFRIVMALLVLLLAITVLLGWQFEIDFLKRPLPESVAMNPLTAVGFLLSAFALLNLKKEKVLKFLSYSLLALGLAKLFSVMVGLNIPVDTTLFQHKLELDLVNGVSNRMAPNTAIGFVLVGLAFLLRTFKNPSTWVIEIITLLVLMQGSLSIIGYGFQVPEFYGILSMFPMAVHTAIGFAFLTFGMLASKPVGPFVKTITSKRPGGLIAKLLIPLTILVPVGLGILKLYGERENLYSSEFGLMLTVATVILFFCFIIWYVATIVNEKDAMQSRVELELAELNAHLEEAVIERTAEAIRSRNEAQEIAEQLEGSKNWFRALVENAGEAVIVLSTDGKPTYVSGSTFRMLGYTKKDVLNMSPTTVVHPDDLVGAKSTMNRALKNPGTPVLTPSLRIRHANDTWRWLEATVTNLLDDPAVKGTVINFHDVTDRIEAETRLRASEIQFRKTLDNMLEGMQIIDFDWKYQYINHAVTKHGGKGREELLGRTMMEVYPGIEHSNLFHVLKQCMTDRTPYHFENEFSYEDGTNAWFELSVQPVPEGVFILSIDITDRKKAQADLNDLNASLEKTVEQRTAQLQTSNEELESFSYSVSHDLRAPLRAINGFSQMLEEQYINQLDDNGKRLLSIIRDNASNMGHLIDDLLEFSRTGRKELRKANVNMHYIVQEVLIDELSAKPEKEPSLNISMLPTAICDPQLIKQVWINLISNAVKYSATVAEPKIVIWADVEESEILFHVQDNGVGFDMQYADKLFGVFQRLHSKRDFEGTGVGLALAYRIINKHGGRIWAEAELNKGATFHFALPILLVDKKE